MIWYCIVHCSHLICLFHQSGRNILSVDILIWVKDDVREIHKLSSMISREEDETKKEALREKQKELIDKLILKVWFYNFSLSDPEDVKQVHYELLSKQNLDTLSIEDEQDHLSRTQTPTSAAQTSNNGMLCICLV